MPKKFFPLVSFPGAVLLAASLLLSGAALAERVTFLSDNLAQPKVRYCFTADWSMSLFTGAGYVIDNGVCPDVLRSVDGGSSQVTTANQTVFCDVSEVSIDQYGQLTVLMQGECIVGGATDSLAMGAIMSNFGQSVQPAGTSMDLDGTGTVGAGDLEFLLP